MTDQSKASSGRLGILSAGVYAGARPVRLGGGGSGKRAEGLQPITGRTSKRAIYRIHLRFLGKRSSARSRGPAL
jgi:hypothetical protein